MIKTIIFITLLVSVSCSRNLVVRKVASSNNENAHQITIEYINQYIDNNCPNFTEEFRSTIKEFYEYGSKKYVDEDELFEVFNSLKSEMNSKSTYNERLLFFLETIRPEVYGLLKLSNKAQEHVDSLIFHEIGLPPHLNFTNLLPRYSSNPKLIVDKISELSKNDGNLNSALSTLESETNLPIKFSRERFDGVIRYLNLCKENGV